MCGIVGMVGGSDETLLRRMCAAIKHRGPDDEGVYLDPNAPAGLGMVRLSIIDLAGGRQPMTDEHQRYRLVFNGEIYNHQALRKELEARGHRFTSNADTEVIVHLYEDVQERCVEYLNGDFAFAIWDTVERRLFLARDRLGVKPLYYWHHGQRFAFASELKALLQLPEVPRDIDLEALDRYLTFLYIPAPHSIFTQVKKLPPACRLTFDDGQARVERYWQPPQPSPHRGRPSADLEEAIVERLTEAVRLRLMSDVPLGAFLSGGIDSSCVVALMSRCSPGRVKTFSLGFAPPDDSYNELPSARLAAQAFQTDHREFLITPDIAALLPQAVWHLDEPFADSSSLLTFLISREARRAVTVALTGIGGDELFGGYPRYLGAWASQSYAYLPAPVRRGLAAAAGMLPESVQSRNVAGWLKRFLQEGTQPLELRYLHWRSYFSAALKTGLYTDDIQASLNGADPYAASRALLRELPGNELDRLNALDLQTYLPDDLLVMGDKMSMAHGLEVRVPFCDHELVELVAAIPLRQRLRGFRLKGLLKHAVRGLLPEALLCKPKQGFMLPLGAWLRGPLAPLCRDILGAEPIRRRGLFRPEAVGRLVEAHVRGEATLTHQVYALLVLELWCRRYLEGDDG
ncbi:MAG: asparagine synthase (glutamine-hydrolyzing) [Candidatus Omnitrophica bacterium]|nr:asparagine synthase (glutamine-hydrolyzing) [Candidatus Omnitrophota bacterium]